MKTRFTTLDLQSILLDLQPKIIGMRAANFYDVDSKTYLIKLVKVPNRALLLIESGIRIHTTEYEWPKNINPSGFAMKCRKHLRTRRVTAITQLGVDRIIDITFGSGHAAYHLIVELYDKGNIVLTDCHYAILSLLRPRTDDADVRFAVGERYPVECAQQHTALTRERWDAHKIRLDAALAQAKDGEPLRKLVLPLMECGPAVIDHSLLTAGFPLGTKIGVDFSRENDAARLFACLQVGENILSERGGKGYIVQKSQKKSVRPENGGPETTEELLTFEEFTPVRLAQHAKLPVLEFDSFDRAVDTFFSQLEQQRLELQQFQAAASIAHTLQEQSALKKLQNVHLDHERRIMALKSTQDVDFRKARAIETNKELVEQALKVIRSAIASSMPWPDIEAMVATAKARNDPVARHIASLSLATNSMTLKLKDAISEEEAVDDIDDVTDDEDDGAPAKPRAAAVAPIAEPVNEGDSSEEEEAVAAPEAKKGETKGEGKAKKLSKRERRAQARGAAMTTKTPGDHTLLIDIDIGLSAYANATNYYERKRGLAQKQQKTIDASANALKNAERKTAQTLKEVATSARINKARKPYWFEKFLWFISSDNYLVIGGRDRQQNDIIIRRILRKGDIYVHADIHGASSVVIKNPSGDPVPPRTVSEAGSMAVVHSSAWEAKVFTSAWWVYHDQVSKTAPSGEYLTTGSSMIRGKKNFLPPGQLVIGFGMLFKVDESCIGFHLHERRAKLGDDESAPPTRTESVADSIADNVAQMSLEPGSEPATPSAGADDAGEEQGGDDKDESESDGEDKFPETGLDREGGPAQPSADTAADEPPASATSSRSEGKKRISAKQRRDMKRGIVRPVAGAPVATAGAEEEGDEDGAQEDEGDVPAAEDTKEAGEKGKDKGAAAKGDKTAGKQGKGAEKTGKKNTQKAKGEEKQKRDPYGKAGKQRSTPKEEPKTDKGEAGLSQLPRGKRAKLQKIKEKYGDQDEEERTIKTQLLAASGESLTLKEKRQLRKEQGKRGSRPPRVPTGAQGAAPQEDDNLDASDDAEEAPQTENAAEEKPAPAPAPEEEEAEGDDVAEAESGDDQAEVQQILEDENVAMDSLTFLDSLTGCPTANDILLFALPVCGPYSAMLNYKYKAKMIPGTGKKGKAARTAVQIFTAAAGLSAREKELIKAVKEEEILRYLPGKVKLMSTGATTVKKEATKERREKAIAEKALAGKTVAGTGAAVAVAVGGNAPAEAQ